MGIFQALSSFLRGDPRQSYLGLPGQGRVTIDIIPLTLQGRTVQLKVKTCNERHADCTTSINDRYRGAICRLTLSSPSCCADSAFVVPHTPHGLPLYISFQLPDLGIAHVVFIFFTTRGFSQAVWIHPCFIMSACISWAIQKICHNKRSHACRWKMTEV